MAQKFFKLALLLIAFVLLAGCCTPPDPIVIHKPVEVKVPVYTPIEPPASLLAAVVIPAIPFFYKPSEKNVTSCLKPEGELKLKQTIFLLSARINEWLIFALPEKAKYE